MQLSNIDALKRSLGRVTDGPWRAQDHGTSVVQPYENPLAISSESFNTVATLRPFDCGSYNPDGAFIALARNNMADLIEAVEALKRVLHEAEALNQGSTTWPFAHRILEKLVAPNPSLTLETFQVNLYAFVTATVMADSLENAAKLVINSPMQLDGLNCSKYDASWSENDAMIVDVCEKDYPWVTDEFEYTNLVEANSQSIDPAKATKLYQVFFYFNIELSVNDAEDEDEAIELAKVVDITGELTMATPVISCSYQISGSVEPTISTSEEF